MATESERLLRAAVKIGADETREGGYDSISIHVTIGDTYQCILDTTSGSVAEASPAEVARARLHLTYASEEVFLDLAHERIKPQMGLLTGKLRFRGEMALGIKLGHWIRKAVVQEVAAPVKLETVEKDKWEKDEDAKVCAVCRQEFTVFLWRHHCRYCGRVVCGKCSASKIDRHRACDPCRSLAGSAKQSAPENVAEGASSSDTRIAKKTLVGDQETTIARELKSRVLELEEEVDNLDRRAFSARARVLRHVVLMVYRLVALGLLATVLFGAHLSATLSSRLFGPKLFEVAIDFTSPSLVLGWSGARLAAAVGRSAGLSIFNAAEVVTTSNASSAAPDDRSEDSGGGGGGHVEAAIVAGGDGSAGAGGVLQPCGDDDSCVGKLSDSDVGSVQDSEAAAKDMTPGAMPQEVLKVQPTDEAEKKQETGPQGERSHGKLHLSLSVYWTVMAFLVVFLGEHQRRTEGLILRRVKTFCLAGTFFLSLKMTQALTQGMSPEDSDDMWADTHKLLAPFVYQSILDIAGMWVKTGQYLSSRADVMPQPYIEELSKLQDAVPASPFEEVDETVREQLGRPLSELFATVDREALASASVAQVHRCTLKDGRKAVIKVQHRRVHYLFLEDLRNISRLVRIVAWAEREYDFRPIMNEWTKESHKELDFLCEARNLLRIHGAMKRSGLEVIVPELIPQFTRRKVVVMTFCEGFKVTDSKALAAAEMDREAVMRAVTEAFAYQIHIDGLFNGDPHPGNILLQPVSPSGGNNGGGAKSALPVLLDWGLAKTLPDNLRIAFSRFVYAGCEHDFVSMLLAFEEMGIKLNRFDPAEDMHNIRFLLRDTQPPKEAKEDMIQFHRRITKKKDRGLKNPVDAYPGDLLFFLRVHALLRALAARLNVRQKYMEIMAPYARQALCDLVPAAERATQAVYPSPVLSLLEIKVRKALESLVQRGKVTGCQVCVIYRGQTLVDLCAGTQGPVDPRPVRPSTLFCVFSAGKAVCSTAVHLLADRGLLRYDQRLSELWPEFARNGKETTTVRHVLTHSTGLQHTFPDKATFDSVCDWHAVKRMLEQAEPAWAPGSRASYHYFTFGWLVAAVVEKASGVPFGKFVRDEIATPLGMEDSFFMGGLGACGVEASRIAHVEHTFNVPGRSTFKLSPKGETQSTGAKTEQAAPVASRRSKKLGEVVGPEPDADSNLGVASLDVIVGAEDIDEDLDDEGAPRLGLLATMASALMEEDPEEGAAIDGLARKLAGREYFLDPRVFNYPQMRDACIPAANSHATAKALATLYDNFLGSLGLNSSRLRNYGRRRRGMRQSVVDAAAVAAVADVAKPPPLLCRARVNEMRAYQVKETSSLHLLFGLPMGGVRYSLGFQMFGFREKPLPPQHQDWPISSMASTASTATFARGFGGTGSTVVDGSTTGRRFFSRAISLLGGGSEDDTVPLAAGPSAPATRGRVRLSGLGHVGMGGSVALCDPASGLAFAMVTNKVATGRESSSSVLSLVCEQLGIGDPSHFFED